MTELQSFLERARQLAVQHAPSDVLQDAVPFALACLVAGIGLSVLGAKLSRFGLTAALAMGGGVVGFYVAEETGYPSPVCGLVGSLMAGVVAFMTFRLWVGVVAAVVFSSAAMGAFGYQRVRPHLAEFNATRAVVPVAAVAGGSFALPSPEAQKAYSERTAQAWARDLWTFVAQRDAKFESNGRVLGLVAALAGLFFGVVAVRTALILSTALAGTGLVGAGTATFLAHSVPQSYQALQGNPALLGMAAGAFFVGSLVVQTLLTRKAPAAEKKTKS